MGGTCPRGPLLNPPIDSLVISRFTAEGECHKRVRLARKIIQMVGRKLTFVCRQRVHETNTTRKTDAEATLRELLGRFTAASKRVVNRRKY